jgi:hypothetical protein
MLKRLATISLVIGSVTQANAAAVAVGSVTNVAIGLDNVAVYITAANGPPCGSSWVISSTRTRTVRR